LLLLLLNLYRDASAEGLGIAVVEEPRNGLVEAHDILQSVLR
jgi:hypothetical protein